MDIPGAGGTAWQLPLRSPWGSGDVVFRNSDPDAPISAVLARDSGNSVFFGLEFNSAGTVGKGEGKDAFLIFSWGTEGGTDPIPGIGPSILPEGGWDAVLAVQGNASSLLWGNGRGEIRPTQVERTFFDAKNGTISFAISKLALVTAGWDGRSPVKFSVLAMADGGSKVSEYAALGDLVGGRWGQWVWRWRTHWINLPIQSQQKARGSTKGTTQRSSGGLTETSHGAIMPQ